MAGAVNAGGQWIIDAGAQGVTNYTQYIFTDLIHKMISGDGSGVDFFSEEALQSLFIGSLLGGIYNLGNIPKYYQMQAIGTALLQTEGAADGLMSLAYQSRSMDVLQAAREAHRSADPMSYGRLMMAVQDELGLTPKVPGSLSSQSIPEDIADYMESDMLIAEILNEDAPRKWFTDGDTGDIVNNNTLNKSQNSLDTITHLDDLLIDPYQLAGISGEELYNYLEKHGYEIKPLSRGSFKDVSFENGGGFKVNWGGDRILQYHPAGLSHHGGAYFKISSGDTGIIRIDLNGNKID